jgi:hypothetical protein
VLGTETDEAAWPYMAADDRSRIRVVDAGSLRPLAAGTAAAPSGIHGGAVYRKLTAHRDPPGHRADLLGTQLEHLRIVPTWQSRGQVLVDWRQGMGELT